MPRYQFAEAPRCAQVQARQPPLPSMQLAIKLHATSKGMHDKVLKHGVLLGSAAEWTKYPHTYGYAEKTHICALDHAPRKVP